MSKRLVFPVAFALVGGVLLANARSSANASAGAAPEPREQEHAPEGTPRTAFQTQEGNLTVLNHWFALGSGCRAKDDVPGDVTMELLPPDPLRPNIHRARFHLDRLHLDSGALSDKSLLKFARECSVRLNINPPPGKKVVGVKATTGIAVEKPQGTKLTVLSELKIGNTTLGHDESAFPSDTIVQSKKSVVELAPGTRMEERFPALTCAEPKIIGFNYTWMAERNAATETVDVQLSDAKTLDIEAELASCN